MRLSTFLEDHVVFVKYQGKHLSSQILILDINSLL